jgi:putative flavoprotein involved in K+ transport
MALPGATSRQIWSKHTLCCSPAAGRADCSQSVSWEYVEVVAGVCLLSAAANSPVGRMMRKSDPFPNRQGDLADRRMGVDVRPRAVEAAGNVVRFGDGTSATVNTVVWALGYRDDSAWIDIPSAKDPSADITEKNGRSPDAGLYFVGRPWQRNRASALIMGAGADAKIIVGELVNRLAS